MEIVRISILTLSYVTDFKAARPYSKERGREIDGIRGRMREREREREKSK